MKKAVILLSGGLDSTTVCAVAKSQNRSILALTIDYQQRHRFELEAAKQIAKRFEVAEHIIFPINLRLFGGSSLTDDSIEVDQNVSFDQIGHSIPSSYVPARNMIFLSLAVAFAETRQTEEIWLGVNNVDYSGYPDCRPAFLHSFEKTAKLATKAGIEETSTFQIKTPLLSLSKGDIIKLGLSLGVDYSMTRTCYSLDENGFSCGKCESCQLRLAGFREAGVDDPVPYINDIETGMVNKRRIE